MWSSILDGLDLKAWWFVYPFHYYLSICHSLWRTIFSMTVVKQLKENRKMKWERHAKTLKYSQKKKYVFETELHSVSLADQELTSQGSACLCLSNAVIKGYVLIRILKKTQTETMLYMKNSIRHLKALESVTNRMDHTEHRELGMKIEVEDLDHSV